MKHWSKHWKVEPEAIRAAVEKVGNSVASVQKELGLRSLIDEACSVRYRTLDQQRWYGTNWLEDA
jgi:hypothetical protein